MKHFFNKIIILIFIAFIAASTVVTSSNFNDNSNGKSQDELSLTNEATTEKIKPVLNSEVTLVDPIIRVINADLGKKNGEIYFEWGLIDEKRQIHEINFSMNDSSKTLIEHTLDIHSIVDISGRFSYAFSSQTSGWQTYEKGSLVSGVYTDVQMEMHDTGGAIAAKYFDDITIEDGKASEPVAMLEWDSIAIIKDAHSQGETIDLTIEYFYDDAKNNLDVIDDFWMTQFIVCAKEVNGTIPIETGIDVSSLQSGNTETATMIGLKPEIEYEFYISYRWDSHSNDQNPYGDNIALLNKTFTPKYANVTEPQIKNVEARNIKPEEITPEGGLKNGEVEVTWEIEDIHDSVTGIIVELESKDDSQESQTSDLLSKEAREHTFTGLGVAPFEAIVKIEYINNMGTQVSIEKNSSVAPTSIATKKVPGVKHDTSKDIYDKRKEILTMHIEIDNRFGLIAKNKYTFFNLYDSNGEHVDTKTLHNSPNASGDFEAKVYGFELKFFDIPPGEYYLEVAIQLTLLDEIYTIVLEAEEYLIPETFVVLIIVSTIGGLILLLLILYLIHRIYRSRRTWKTDSVEKDLNETPKSLKIELELLSLTKVMDQVSISILDDNKSYGEEIVTNKNNKQRQNGDKSWEQIEDHEDKEILTGMELLKIPNIILNEDDDYKHIILLPTLKNSVKIDIVAPKKRIRKMVPFCWTSPDHQEHTLNRKIEEITSEEVLTKKPKKEPLKYDKDGQGHYLTIKKEIKTKYIKGGKYELHIAHSSNTNKEESLWTKRELLTNIVITFRKLS